MPSLKDVVRQAHGIVESAKLADDDPNKVLPEYVLPRHLAWMRLPESKRHWTPEALAYAAQVMSGEFQHERKARFSPSGLGSACQREVLFSFGGAPKQPFPLSNQEKMDSGAFDHLRWQMEGMSAGYMKLGEVWVFNEGMRMGGSADGLLDDGSLFELKNTGGHLFDCAKELLKPKANRRQLGPMNYFLGMHHKHKLQMEAYWECDRLSAVEEGRERIFTDYGSLVYQDTGTKGIIEFRIKSNPHRLTELHTLLESLHGWVDIDQLPDMLEGCLKSIGVGAAPDVKELTVFQRCAYREYCPTATAVTAR